MAAYYNENDPFAAAWLRQLIEQGLIADGYVDERSILDVRPDDLEWFDQCHFFAGIGVWSYALRAAGWPDRRPIWTGSCPCQPFSEAGRGGGFADERHLWPAFHHLIRQCRPGAVIGEQVASKDGLAWLDLVQADMEGEDYAFAAVDLCAAGVGAPHIRQRLWWVGLADADRERHQGQHPLLQSGQPRQAGAEAAGGGEAGGLAQPLHAERRALGVDREDGRDWPDAGRAQAHGLAGARGEVHRLADAAGGGSGAGLRDSDLGAGTADGWWSDADWLYCRDAKWRPVEPGTFPLVDGAPARVGRLRGYGNAINAEAARVFIEAVMEA